MSGAEPFLLAAATGLQVVGAISSANAESAAAKRQAQVDQRNQILADQDRVQGLRTSQIAADDLARSNRRKLASLRASMGSSGLELAGSPLDLLQDTSIEMALDVRRTEYEGEVGNRAGKIESANYADAAAASKARASNAKTSGYASAGAALLSGGTKSYSSFKENGYFK